MQLKEQATQNLREVRKVLNNLGLIFWLDFGTLLGAYRDKDFCEGDEDDIDLSTWDNYLYLKPTIINELKKRGFELYRDWELEIAITRGESKIDIFFHRWKNDYAYTHLYSGNQIVKYVITPSKYFKDLKPILFKDMEFLMPSPIEEYLKQKYGDWKTKIHRRDYLCINEKQHLSVKSLKDAERILG